MAQIQDQNQVAQNNDVLPVYSSSQILGFNVSLMPPNTKIYVYCNGVDITKFCAPATNSPLLGQSIVTDQLGNASGYLFIPSFEGPYKFLAGEMLITFGDAPNSIADCKYISEAIFMNHGLDLVDTEQGGTLSLRRMEKLRTDVSGSSTQPNTTQARLDPLAQTFVVDGTKYPLGIFVTGINLFFYTKDDTLPIAVELRPMVNGKPSTTEYFSGSFSALNANNVNVYDQATGDIQPTIFSFAHLIYLKPGEYAFCVTTKSTKYQIFSAKQGDGLTVKQPFAGLLFKPQNTGDWVGDNSEDLTFVIRKAKFKTGTSTFKMKNATLDTVNEYSRLRLLSTEINFGSTAMVDYRIQTTQAGSGIKSDFKDIATGGFATLDSRQTVSNDSDTVLEVSMTTKNQDVSPILDRQLMSAQIFNPLIKPYTSEISASELLPNSGTARSRYISKVISLQEGFDSTGLQVKLDVNRKVGTDIEVFGRVLSRTDNAFVSGIKNKPWVKMPLYAPQQKTYAGTSDSKFNQETYQLLEPLLSYTNAANIASNVAITASYTDFAQYQIKVVFYSNDAIYLPKIKNLTATSVI
jgi:hypothetical protein